MKLKQSSLLIISAALILMSANSYAGRQGISFYYGLGLDAILPQDPTGAGIDFDPTAGGEAILGIEEDGWSLEGIAYTSIEAGTDISNLDYSVDGTHLGLAYRTIEKRNFYYKYKISGTKMDFDLKNTTTNASATAKTSGSSYTFGVGWRVDRAERLELDYSYYNSSDIDDAVHLITLKYLWGGTPYQGKSF